MVKNFTIADWNQNLQSKELTMMKGMFIPITQSDPIIQVFRIIGTDSNGNKQYQLANGEISIAASAIEVLLLAQNPFDGKVVIK